MAKTEEIECPSGLKGEIRNLKGEEGNVLADRRIQKQNKLIDEILKRTWIRTIDPGLVGYSINGAGPDWSEVLAGDRMFAFIQARILTWGTEYAFKVQCQTPTCGRAFEWEINLSELPIQKLSKESAAIFKNGNKFPVKIPSDGRLGAFQLMTGKDERKASSAIQENRDQLITQAVKARLVAVDGIKEKDMDRYLSELDLSDHSTLISLFDEQDCGINTTIEVECPMCLSEFEAELPFSGDFFFPRMKKKKSPPVSSVSGG